MEDTLAYGGAFYILNKLYFSSLLATLNRREMLRAQMHAPTGGMISISFGTNTNTRAGEGLSVAMDTLGNEGDTGTMSEIRTKTEMKTMGDPVSAVYNSADQAQAGFFEIKVERHVI
ncbi:hypothetical protein JR316_0007552 [Psilocybe cubensis]|uniref:Uncharacterized protein n=1 Tax=Psilocybe cubensis TaxID=181762 RepID=A0ACB8GZN7_PSICU|nr:hypothetical protein JR316_0007552 [Psilocybe cubensis]KAH9480945.1 hypothetical protein JR316_0007552 [Psilocybe cubensis]